MWVLLGWLVSALWQSVVVFYISAWALSLHVDASGILVGMWASGTLAYTLVATIVSSQTWPCSELRQSLHVHPKRLSTYSGLH